MGTLAIFTCTIISSHAERNIAKGPVTAVCIPADSLKMGLDMHRLVVASFISSAVLIGCSSGSISLGPGSVANSQVAEASSVASASSSEIRQRRRRFTTYSGATGNWPPGDYVPFSTVSYYNLSLARDTGGLIDTDKVAADSAAIMSVIFANGGINGEAFGVAAGSKPNRNPEYSLPFYYASSSAPLYSIHCTNNPCPALEGTQIHIPSGAVPEQSGPIVSNGQTSPQYGPSGDAHMAVLDIANNREIDFYGATNPNGTSSTVATNFDVSTAGVGPLSDSGSSYATGYGADGENPEPFNATHSDSALTIGIIRPKDLLSSDGAIDHALQVSVPCAGVAGNTQGVVPFDYVFADTICSSGTSVPQYGMRLFLAATQSQLSSLGLNAYQMSIWSAMARFGALVSDVNGGSSIQFQTEDPLTYTTQGYPNLWDTVAANAGIAAYSDSHGSLYSFQLAPNASAAAFLQNHLEVIEYGADCIDVGVGSERCRSYSY